MRITFAKSELRDLAFIIIVLAFCFSFRWSGPLTLSAWLSTYIKNLILVGISVLIHEIAHRAYALKYRARIKTGIWWSGVLTALIILFLTNGHIVLASIWTVIISSWYMIPGKTKKKWALRAIDSAKIAAVGPLSNYALALLGSVIGANEFVRINIWLAITNLIPYYTILPGILFGRLKKKFRLPFFEGEYILWGSRSDWLALFSMVVIGSLLLWIIPAIYAAIISALIGFCAILIWYWYMK